MQQRSVAVLVIAVIAVFGLSLVLPVAGQTPLSPLSASPAAVPAPTSTVSTASGPSASAGGGPHPGTLDVYEIAPGGATTEDPSVAYDTVSFEPILNTYQTLVQYDGNSAASFLPVLANCVPGPGCQAEYGQSLIVNNPSTGLPEYWTFVINSHARFYDPSTGASWPVYPSDVMFSLARTMSFADLPGVASQPGWIQTQALLPFGNSSWDNAYHFPYNNTPSNVLTSMMVNDSTYCPAAAMTSANGCITFNAYGGGVDWSYFLELVADPLGAGIEPCGWFTYMGAGVPGFPGTHAANGDGPCLLPGNATSTTQSSFQAAVAAMSPTYWDSFQLLALNTPAIQPSVQFKLVGSGPYYTAYISKAVGYVLKANPAYAQPNCAGVPNCEPAPGSYPSTVNVYWEPNDQVGIQEYTAGQADFAGILQTDTSILLQLQQEGKIGIYTAPSLSIFFLPFDLMFNVTAEKAIDPVGKANIPSTFFANNGLRNFLTRAWPYTTINQTINTIDGVNYGFNTGGPIPKFMGNYYPYNVSFPNTDPVANPNVNGSAGWWWAQATTKGSPYYDPQLANCTSASPCYFPVIGQQGATSLDEMLSLYDAEIKNLTGGALQPYSFDLTFTQLVVDSLASSPGNSPLPYYNLGWAPDYPDPTDYMVPMAAPNATYTYGDAVYQALAAPQYNQVSVCGHAAVQSYANLLYWAHQTAIANACQGIAYQVSQYWQSVTGSLPVGYQRTLNFNLIEHILNNLALYVWYEQANVVGSYAPWINPSTINTNPMIGGGGDQPWYAIGYASNVQTVYFNETGLRSGTTWSVTVAGQTYPTTGVSLAVPLSNGAYNYTVSFVTGYGASPASGRITVNVTSSTTQTVAITYTPFPSQTYAVTFTQVGVISGTPWSVTVVNVGSFTTTGPSVTFGVPAGTYSYVPGVVGGYKTPAAGTVSVSSGPAAVTLTYASSLYKTYAVTFTATGTLGTVWSVNVSGLTYSTTGSSLVFFEQNGTFSYIVSATPGMVATPSHGTFKVNGAALAQPVAFTLSAGFYTVTFTETGLPAGTTWQVTLGVTTLSTSGTTLIFTEANGTYPFTVGAISGFLASPASGSLTVSGSAQSQTVTFTSLIVTYTVTFVARGLSSGQTWSVTVSGAGTAPISGIAKGNAWINFTLANGVYVWTTAGPSGMYATPSGGTITVSGSSMTAATVAWSSTSTTTSASSTYLSPLAYGLIGLFAVLFLVFLATTISARRRRPPAAPTSWNPDSTTTPSETAPKTGGGPGGT